MNWSCLPVPFTERYFASLLKPHISGDILEAGAGNGANTLT